MGAGGAVYGGGGLGAAGFAFGHFVAARRAGRRRFSFGQRVLLGRQWLRFGDGECVSAAEQHVAASFGGSLWVIGGSTDAVLYDIWASADGASWTQVTASASFGRRIDSAIAAHDDNKLYLVNGNLTRNGGEVWVSSDGGSWALAHSSATPFSQTSGDGLASFKGRLVFVQANRDSPTVYTSTDGSSWGAAGVPAFGHRDNIELAVLGTAAASDAVETFEVPMADLSLAGTLEAAHAIPVAATTPMALGTLSVSGGRGQLFGGGAADGRGVGGRFEWGGGGGAFGFGRGFGDRDSGDAGGG